MAFTPLQGSDGRLKAIIIVADLTLPAPAIGAGVTAAIAGITKFTIEFEDNHGDPIHHFESSATTNGMLWGEQINGGTQVYKAPIEGYLNLDATSTYAGATPVVFNNGVWLKADFVYDKAVATGHYANQVKVSALRFLGPEVKGGPVKFSCVLLGHGALTALSVS